MPKTKNAEKDYEFIDKALYFPEKGILVIGDLHLGYDYMLRQSGILIPERQLKDIIEDLNQIFKRIHERRLKINKIIFLGDITHAFGFEFQERDEFLEIIEFLENEVPKENIILIKGNHDTMDYSHGNMKDCYVEDGIAFLHGHESFPEIFDKKINLVVTGHLHPSVILEERPGVKREAYKCFLEGTFNGKTLLVIPSFFGFIEGTAVNDYKEGYWEFFSIIPKKDILNAKIHVIGKDKIYDFGKVGEL